MVALGSGKIIAISKKLLPQYSLVKESIILTIQNMFSTLNKPQMIDNPQSSISIDCK